tara:strand:+ start:108 stop:602 length:495 start_codon:yes stop_codon:yes gene_type:complete
MSINFGNNDFQNLPAAYHQIIHSTTTSSTSRQNNTGFVNVSGMTGITISPKSSSSKILIHICGSCMCQHGGGGSNMEGRILRDGSQIWESSCAGRNNAGHYHESWTHIMMFDNPATTSSVSYTFQIRESHGNTHVKFNGGDGNLGTGINYRADMYLVEVGEGAL